MDDDSSGRKLLIGAFGAVGLGAAASFFAFPRIGIWIALIIIAVALLLFGGFYIWQRWRAQRKTAELTSGLEAQSSAVPRNVGDPELRANLDSLRQKWQDGLKEFKSRGKDIYKLPWFVIIGEPGSGKTEAIRHSAIDFPAGMNPEQQGSGGTINMDWWFTNRGIIIDTAGKMIIPDEAAEEQREDWKPRKDWIEFLRLLRKSRPACPINGLLLVLSTESLIKDTADKIAYKASRLAKQLDIIQTQLDVRFPVYLLVTKCDLLAGFREFSDSITDPLLQHQIFGWSNPDPLDAPFRPDLVEQYLGALSERICRRRLALLRDGVGGRPGETQVFFGSGYQGGRSAAAPRRLDEVDSMFALPQSVMLLAPRLRRYLETIFVAGEWSAKPVFLRGIYFTSSMREGAALDEALALATGMSLDQMPERARNWESRAFFLRDLFHEKIFREYGLVTRATNTLKMLRQRQLLIFGTATVLLLLLLGFSYSSYLKLKEGVGKEAKFWQAGTNGWDRGEWTNAPIVSLAPRYQYLGSNTMPGLDTTVLGYHQELMTMAAGRLPVGRIFAPIAHFSDVKSRPEAQRILFEGSVLRPLIEQTWGMMARSDKPSTNAIAVYKAALLDLIRLEAEGKQHPPIGTNAESYLRNFLSYLTESDQKVDTNLLNILLWTYSPQQIAQNRGNWPPPGIYGATPTSVAWIAITNGLAKFQLASQDAQEIVTRQLDQLVILSSNLVAYQAEEMAWLTNHSLQTAPEEDARSALAPLGQIKSRLDLALGSNSLTGQVTNLDLRFDSFQKTMSNSSEAALSRPVRDIIERLNPSDQVGGIFKEVSDLIKGFAQQASRIVEDKRKDFRGSIPSLDSDLLAPSSQGFPIYAERWILYTNAADLASQQVTPSEADIGNRWTNYSRAAAQATRFQDGLNNYRWALSNQVNNACSTIALRAKIQLENGYVTNYAWLAAEKLSAILHPQRWDVVAIEDASNWVSRIESDLNGSSELGDQASLLNDIQRSLPMDKGVILTYFAKSPEAAIAQRFPLCLSGDPARAMTIDELRRFNALIATLSIQAEAPVWKTASPESLQNIKSVCGRYDEILKALLTTDGNFAKWKISFKDLKGNDITANRAVLMVYRYAKVSMNDKEGTGFREPLSPGNPPAGVDGSVQSPVNIELYDSSDPQHRKLPPRVMAYAGWGLLQLAPYATREGTSWRIKIPLEAEKTNGSAIFTVSFEPDTQPLPDPQDWLNLCH